MTAPTPIASATWPRNLDELAALDVARLTELYQQARAPESMRTVAGDPVCRMLAVRGLDRRAAGRAVRRLAGSSRFPWIGKRFEATGDHEGGGINWVRLGGEHTWFPFETRFEPSAIDGAPCVFLDYRLPANPAPIRLIRDELRELDPGLLFGPALLDNGRAPARLVLYFACDFR